MLRGVLGTAPPAAGGAVDLGRRRRAVATAARLSDHRATPLLAPLRLAPGRQIPGALARRRGDPLRQAELPARGHPAAGYDRLRAMVVLVLGAAYFTAVYLAKHTELRRPARPALRQTHLRRPRLPLLRPCRRHRAAPLPLPARPRTPDRPLRLALPPAALRRLAKIGEGPDS